VDAAKKIYAEEGIIGFYRGLTPNYAKVIPSIAITFWTYDSLKKWMFDN